MKILCFTDNHFCEKSSIITKYGTKYTQRLENQLKSINWVETTALKQNCDLIVCLGDFFDKAHLTDQELTALSDIQWSNIPHYFLVGNHESEENDLQYSSTMALTGENREIIASPCLKSFETVELAFLPYTVESNRVPLTELFSVPGTKVRLLFSHNDIQGIQLGPVISKTGYTVEELEKMCDLCVNGHLHNGTTVSARVINMGNLTGKDFGEDATRYKHGVIILDTDTMNMEFIENPHAFNFYKLEIIKTDDIFILETLKTNAVLSIKCKDTLVSEVRSKLEALPNVLEARVIITKDMSTAEVEDINLESLMVDQCTKFAECCRAKLDNDDILEAELAEVLK